MQKARVLQSQYYSLMHGSKNKRQFTLTAADKVANSPEYYSVRYEVEKLHTICFSSHYDA